jgi:hypothetical protein
MGSIRTVGCFRNATVGNLPWTRDVGRTWTVDRFGSVDVRPEEKTRTRWRTFHLEPVPSEHE